MHKRSVVVVEAVRKLLVVVVRTRSVEAAQIHFAVAVQKLLAVVVRTRSAAVVVQMHSVAVVQKYFVVEVEQM